MIRILEFSNKLEINVKNMLSFIDDDCQRFHEIDAVDNLSVGMLLSSWV